MNLLLFLILPVVLGYVTLHHKLMVSFLFVKVYYISVLESFCQFASVAFYRCLYDIFMSTIYAVITLSLLCY